MKWLWNKVQKDRISGALNKNKPSQFHSIPQSSLPGSCAVAIPDQRPLVSPDQILPASDFAPPASSDSASASVSDFASPASSTSAVSLPFTCNSPQAVLDSLDFEEEMMSESESDTDSFEFSDIDYISDTELSSEENSSKSDESQDTMSSDQASFSFVLCAS